MAGNFDQRSSLRCMGEWVGLSRACCGAEGKCVCGDRFRADRQYQSDASGGSALAFEAPANQVTMEPTMAPATKP